MCCPMYVWRQLLCEVFVRWHIVSSRHCLHWKSCSVAQSFLLQVVECGALLVRRRGCCTCSKCILCTGWKCQQGMGYSVFSVQVGYIIVWFLDFLQVFNQAKKNVSTKRLLECRLRLFDFQNMTHSAIYLTILNRHIMERQTFLLQMSLNKSWFSAVLLKGTISSMYNS